MAEAAPRAMGELLITMNEGTVYEADLVPTLWWLTLVVGSIINFVVLLGRLSAMPQDVYPRKLTYCAAAFIIACGVRSIWPRVDVERTCFWDSRISWPFVGRVLATIAEICFAGQFSMTIGVLAQEACFPRTKRVADVLFWAICIAQCCCWMGVTTQRQIWHGLEESIWAGTFAAVAVCCAVLLRHSRRTANCGIFAGLTAAGDKGYVHRFLVLGIPASVVYVTFMVLVDIPMYVNRYMEDQARGTKYFWVSEGVLDSMSCRSVSKSMADWRPEIPWMSGYFLFATMVSLWLTWGPKFGTHDKDL